MTFPKKQKVRSKNEVFILLLKYCAYRERSFYETKVKLSEYKLNTNEVNEILDKLVKENFINDQRFAEVFAGSKFRLKKWGILKIKSELLLKGIDKGTIEIAISSEIDQDEYEDVLNGLALKKMEELEKEERLGTLELKSKVFRYLMSKGYESDLITDVLKKLNFQDH